MKKSTKKKLISFLITLSLFIFFLVLDSTGIINIEDYLEKGNSYTTSISQDTYEVIRVVDGDTLVIDYEGNEEKVRLIGVDTPESVHPDKTKNTSYGKLASEYTKEKLLGKSVSLEFDVEKRDKYGRLLAYLYLNGKMYNKTLLEEGYAKVATFPPNVKYVDEFVKIAKIARENNVGLWGYEED